MLPMWAPLQVLGQLLCVAGSWSATGSRPRQTRTQDASCGVPP